MTVVSTQNPIVPHNGSEVPIHPPILNPNGAPSRLEAGTQDKEAFRFINVATILFNGKPDPIALPDGWQRYFVIRGYGGVRNGNIARVEILYGPSQPYLHPLYTGPDMAVEIGKTYRIPDAWEYLDIRKVKLQSENGH